MLLQKAIAGLAAKPAGVDAERVGHELRWTDSSYTTHAASCCPTLWIGRRIDDSTALRDCVRPEEYADPPVRWGIRSNSV